MRMIKDYEARLTALNKLKTSIIAKKVQQLGQLVIATGLGDLEPEVIAGIMLHAMAKADSERMEHWRAKGAAFFLSRSRKPRGETAVSDSSDGSSNGGD
jgi:hypothetical protein